ncbi:DivIVA domain-containing protein [Bifidobacterium cebidarum]|uniref:Dihydrouridine synthase n=1 Tax=Bifidobacterium cebidarum TaxID=2650773 RepID=A0A6I1GI46_9BIFI|nr:DivIVA domain-containing protein [Bifidobacterium cebidarum]KAB7785716.1 dihydrouridine synthase [Bifidobacterium cebidarum]
MAKEVREGDGKTGIARAGKRKLGYDTAQVDAFLERAHALYDSEGINLTQQDIQSVSFDLAKDGYVISQVDATLNRLERAVVDKQTAWEIAQQGRVAWKAQTEKLYQEVASHVERAPRERFKPGEPKHPSYDRKQVDRIADQVVDKAAASLGVDGVTQDDVKGLADLNASAVNNVIFTQRKGKKGYDERQVDYFLNVCVQLLSRLESYARVGDYVTGGAASPEQSAPVDSAATAVVAADGVSPLIATGAQRATAQAPVDAVPSGESFDALRKAEQNLFPAPAAPQAAVAPAAPQAAVAPAAVNPAPVAYAPAAAAPTAATEQTALTAPAAVAPQAPAYQPAPEAESLPSFQPSTHPVSTAEAPVTVSASDAAAESETTAAASAPAPVIVDATENNSSLAALAHMAEVSQELPTVDVSSFTPKMPSLDTPNALKLNDTPAVMPASFAPASKPARMTNATPSPVPETLPQHPAAAAAQPEPAPAAQSQTQPQPQSVHEPAEPKKDAETNKPGNLFPLIPNLDDDFGVSIPDLSFPTLNDDDMKKEQ